MKALAGKLRNLAERVTLAGEHSRDVPISIEEVRTWGDGVAAVAEAIDRIPDGGAAAPLAAAAKKFDDARREALELRKQRASFHCVSEDVAEGVLPCWKISDTDEFGNRYRNDDLCEPCVERSAVHEKLALANRRRGAALRSLQRLALAYEP